MMFASTNPRRRHSDPTPYVSSTGARLAPGQWYLMLMSEAGGAGTFAPRPEFVPATSNPANVILDRVREYVDTSEMSAYDTHEWLIQLARHWALWQSPLIGTFPLDYSDPSGPVDRATSEDTGEDDTYYAIDDVIREYLESKGVSIHEGESQPGGWSPAYRIGTLGAGDDVALMIAHATAVLARLDAAYMLRGDL